MVICILQSKKEIRNMETLRVFEKQQISQTNQKLQTRYYNMFHFTSIQLQWHRPFNSPCNGAKPSRSILSPFGEQLRAEWSAGAEGD